MPKTIATTPSWYWPDTVPRVFGVPPVPVAALAVDGPARRRPQDAALSGDDGADLTASELAARVAATASAVRDVVSPEGAVAVAAGPGAAGVVAVLGALASGRRVALAAADDDRARAVLEAARPDFGLCDAEGADLLSAAGVAVLEVGDEPPTALDETPAAGAGSLRDERVCLSGSSGPVWHSQRSLLAGALVVPSFFEPEPGSAWLVLQSPCSWDGLAVVVGALAAGCPVVAAVAGDGAVEATERYQPGWITASLEDAGRTWSGGGGRRRRSQGVPGRWLVATVDGPFDPDERRSVGAAAGGGALTLFGMGEIGPVLAAHPSWFLDEPAGIPVPNMHVLPADPDTGEPIDVMWELLDHAMVSAWSPALALSGFPPGPGAPAGRRFATGVLAASDPNGMLYLVDP
ncbi:MAG: AMP-binding protein [Actinomycetota bacterium]|nr:AMP-binding protein [Actinomycetota bacterium]